MASADISDILWEKLKKVVKDPDVLKLIEELWNHERRYEQKEKPQTIKREFQLLLDQYFPIGSSSNG